MFSCHVHIFEIFRSKFYEQGKVPLLKCCQERHNFKAISDFRDSIINLVIMTTIKEESKGIFHVHLVR